MPIIPYQASAYQPYTICKTILHVFSSFFKKFSFIYTYFWLCWVFVSVRGLSLVAASGGHSSSQCAGLSLSRPLLLRSTGSRRAGSVAVAHGPSCSAACGILPDQGSNPCPLHWQADSQPLLHQGSPLYLALYSLQRGLRAHWYPIIFLCYFRRQAHDCLICFSNPLLSKHKVPSLQLSKCLPG